MLYHQSEKTKNDHKLTVIKNVKYKYTYNCINVPGAYADIDQFEDLNRNLVLCIMK